jgi:hypothetical protein
MSASPDSYVALLRKRWRRRSKGKHRRTKDREVFPLRHVVPPGLARFAPAARTQAIVQ